MTTKASTAINAISEAAGGINPSQFGVNVEHINWARKPVDWDDVDGHTTKLPQELLDSLKTYAHPYNINPDKNFNFEPPQYFLYKRGKKLYFINTEGYNYPRYIVRVVK